MFVICHVRLLVGIQFRFATVHSSVTQPEAASIGSVLPRGRITSNYTVLLYDRAIGLTNVSETFDNLLDQNLLI